MAKQKQIFMITWRNKFIAAEATNFKEMVEAVEYAAKTLREMLNSGKVFVKDGGGIEDDYAELYTYDAKIALTYGFEPA